MLIGVPKETKDNEYRVGLVPSAVHELTSAGHSVVESASSMAPAETMMPWRLAVSSSRVAVIALAT